MIKDIDILAREWADPHVASDEELGRLLGPGVPWARVVVRGDSIAAGVREPSPGYRDLSWSDRLAAGLALARPGAVVHNLGQRDLTAAEVREAQLDAALALGPDLAIVAAGGNDLLRREFDPGVVRQELSAIVTPLRAAGADILTFDLLDNTGTGLVPERFVAILRERLAQLADATRVASTALGGWHAPLRTHPAATDMDIFAGDGLHLNARGHAIVGTELARCLRVARGGALLARQCLPG
jgi:lysophospholipase L1-like esterase